MTDYSELIVLRVSMYRVAQMVGLREEKPVQQIVQDAGNDRGWNRLGAEICMKVDYHNALIKDLQEQLKSKTKD
jgi:hypothetical protein